MFLIIIFYSKLKLHILFNSQTLNDKYNLLSYNKIVLQQ